MKLSFFDVSLPSSANKPKEQDKVDSDISVEIHFGLSFHKTIRSRAGAINPAPEELIEDSKQQNDKRNSR